MSGITPLRLAPADVFLSHYRCVCEALSSSCVSLEAIVSRLYETRVIGLQLKCAVAQQLGRSAIQTATKLLADYLLLVIAQNQQYLSIVLRILSSESCSTDIAERMKSRFEECEQRISLIHFNKDFVSISSSNINAKPLKQKYSNMLHDIESFLEHNMTSFKALKLELNLLMQYYQPHGYVQVQAITSDLLWQSHSPQEFIHFLLKTNLLGFIGTGLLLVVEQIIDVNNSAGSSNGIADQLLEHIGQYKQQLDSFFQQSTAQLSQSLHDALSINERIITGLPVIKVQLDKKLWNNKSFYQWKETLHDLMDSAKYLLLLDVNTNFVISYAVLPFYLPSLLLAIQDVAIGKCLATIGCSIDIESKVDEQTAISEVHWMKMNIHEANKLLDTTPYTIDKPVNATSIQFHQALQSSLKSNVKKLKPIPQPAPDKLDINGGYDDEIFLFPPSKDLQCIICLLTLKEPHLTTCCGASICKLCMMRTEARTICPQCRNDGHLIVPDKKTKGKTMSLKVKCTNVGQADCKWKGELIDYTQHITQKCPNRIVQCQYECGDYYKATDIAVHEEECTKRPYNVIVQSYEKQIEDIKNKHSKLISPAKAEHEMQLHDLKEKQRKQIIALEQRHENEIKNLKDECSHQLSAADEEHDHQIYTQEEKRVKKLQQIETLHYQAQKNHERNLSSLKSQLKQDFQVYVDHIKALEYDQTSAGVSKTKNAISICKQKLTKFESLSSCISATTLPIWHTSSLSPPCLIAPCTIAMNSFTKHKLNRDSWYSPPFYTRLGGYKLQLRIVTVTAATSTTAENVSVVLYIMRGENDDCLGWPFKGSVTVKLLNWIENKNHLEQTFDTNILSPASTADLAYNRVTDDSQSTELLLYFRKDFASLSQLEYNADYKTQYLMNDVLCFEIGQVKVVSGYHYNLTPAWCYSEIFSSHYGILPVYRTIEHYSQHKENDYTLYTEPFYTTKGGYKLTLRVNPYGHGSGIVSHVSVFICLMKGPNDNSLQFPITGGIFIVQILNWKQNNQHFEKSIEFDNSIPINCRERVVTGERAVDCWGKQQFVSHYCLLVNNDDKQYILEDKVCFKISFLPQLGLPAVPYWCDNSNSATTPPCTRTLYNYSVYKKNNFTWYSQPFYTSDEGYRLQLRVDANGSGEGKGTHLSLYVRLMKGEYDDALSWPFNANINVQILNWTLDDYHLEKTIKHYTTPSEYCTRIINGDAVHGVEIGCDQFLTHTLLEDSSNDYYRLIEEDKLAFFIVDVETIRLC